jgi:putative endonuclease
MDSPEAMGRDGEHLAARFLTAHGYTILETNWRCPFGEADLVALHGQDLVIVEVKTRRGRGAFDRALEAITPEKQARLVALAEAYHAQLGRDDLGLRVDVVTVTVTPGEICFNVHENAVGW